MNVERLKEYRRRLAEQATRETFQMGSFLVDTPKDAHRCGTAACVAGYLPQLFPEYASYITDKPTARCFVHGVREESLWCAASEFLGLSEGQSEYLFSGNDRWGDDRDDSPNALQDALFRMDWLIENPDCDEPRDDDAPDYYPYNKQLVTNKRSDL